MEPFPSPLAFLSLNLASEISSFLNFFDLQNLGLVSKKIRHIFYENVNCFNSILTQKSCPIQKTIDSIDELKSLLTTLYPFTLHSIRQIKIKYSLFHSPTLYFSASSTWFAWRESDYWPLHPHKDSLFGDLPIPHLDGVCWFEMREEFIIPRGKYAFFLRIAGDQNFELRSSHFILEYGKMEEEVGKGKNASDEGVSLKSEEKKESNENMGKHTKTNKSEKNNESEKMKEGDNILRIPFPKEVEYKCKKNAGKFLLWEMGKIELKGGNNVNVRFRTEHKDDWWKHGWWLDCFVFKPIK